LRLQRAARTNGGKSDDDATLSCGSVARSLNYVPQARPHGRERAACKIFEQIRLQRLSSKRQQLSKSSRSYPAFGLAPCAHACDGGLLGRAAAP
jgi:hypothetical protein